MAQYQLNLRPQGLPLFKRRPGFCFLFKTHEYAKFVCSWCTSGKGSPEMRGSPSDCLVAPSNNSFNKISDTCLEVGADFEDVTSFEVGTIFEFDTSFEVNICWYQLQSLYTL